MHYYELLIAFSRFKGGFQGSGGGFMNLPFTLNFLFFYIKNSAKKPLTHSPLAPFFGRIYFEFAWYIGLRFKHGLQISQTIYSMNMDIIHAQFNHLPACFVMQKLSLKTLQRMKKKDNIYLWKGIHLISDYDYIWCETNVDTKNVYNS